MLLGDIVFLLRAVIKYRGLQRMHQGNGAAANKDEKRVLRKESNDADALESRSRDYVATGELYCALAEWDKASVLRGRK